MSRGTVASACVSGIDLLPVTFEICDKKRVYPDRIQRVFVEWLDGVAMYKYLICSPDGGVSQLNEKCPKHGRLWRLTDSRPPYFAPHERGLLEYCGFDTLEDAVAAMKWEASS